MAEQVSFSQIAVAVLPGAAQRLPGEPREALHLFGVTGAGAVYQYLSELDAKVAGGGWKKMSMQVLP